MKKILLAFEGTHFSEGAFEFARKLNELQPILLTGVFLPQLQLSTAWNYGTGDVWPTLETDNTERVTENIARFEKLCVRNLIDYRVHKDFYDLAIPELKKESRFADLLILGSEVFFKTLGTDAPNDLLMDALHDVECPVLLVPEKFAFPESIVLAYDGSHDAVFSIKQFAYLFPELVNRNTLLVYSDEDAETDFPDKIQIEELAARHYPDLTFFKLELDPKKIF